MYGTAAWYWGRCARRLEVPVLWEKEEYKDLYNVPKVGE
jgi:hypothetical protein